MRYDEFTAIGLGKGPTEKLAAMERALDRFLV
jgi:hypothetical protein